MTVKVLVLVVVVGSVTVVLTNEEPQVIALAAVPVICISRISPSFGVPDKLVVKEVISAACAVSLYISTLSVFIVGVADEVVLPTLAVHRLFVSVTEFDSVTGAYQLAAYSHFPFLVSHVIGFL